MASSENTTSQTAPAPAPAPAAASANANANALELVAQCLCKTHTFTTQIQVHDNDKKEGDILPLEAIYCHCTSCRRSTGALYSASVVWPGSLSSTDPHDQHQLFNLRRYKRTADSPSTGLFCPTCSTLLLYEYDYQGSIIHGVFLGCLRGYELDSAGNRIRPVTKGLVKPGHHLFVGDTGDGGAVCWMKAWGGDQGQGQVKLWMGHRDYSEEISRSSPLVEVPSSSTRSSTSTKEEEKKEREGEVPEEVAIKCHCGGVNFTLQTGASRREYLSKIQQEKTDELPWFVNPQNGKMIGTLDGCDSCTTSAGADLFNWTFAEVKYLAFPKPREDNLKFPADAAELRKAVEEHMRQLQLLENKHDSESEPKRERNDSGSPFGTLAFYASSPDVQRYFCSVCSATIFYACDDRPEMVDIAVGVVCSPAETDGVRAETIISWPWDREALGNDGRNGPKPRIGWREDMLGCWKAGIVDAVEGEVENIAKQHKRGAGKLTG